MSAGKAAEYAGWIIGALVGCLFSLLGGDELLVVMIVTFIGGIVGAAVGYAGYMVMRS